MLVQVMVAPVLNEPVEKAEMVTQVVLGTWVEIIETKGQWCRIIIREQKGYAGWTKKEFLCQPTADTEIFAVRVAELLAPLKERSKETAQTIDEAVFQAFLPVCKKEQAWILVKGPFAQKAWIYRSHTSLAQKSIKGARLSLLKNAEKFLGTPYMWGGMTPYGIDCSGFIHVLFASENIFLHRDAHLQYAWDGIFIERQKLQPADLVFFDTLGKGVISHVGIYQKDGHFINASSSRGKVLVDHLDQDKWPHYFKGAKRIIHY